MDSNQVSPKVARRSQVGGGKEGGVKLFYCDTLINISQYVLIGHCFLQFCR